MFCYSLRKADSGIQRLPIFSVFCKAKKKLNVYKSIYSQFRTDRYSK
jgi:hypothetical protein